MLSITLSKDIPNEQMGGLVLAEFINSEAIVGPDEADKDTKTIDIVLVLKYLESKMHLLNDYALFRIIDVVLDTSGDLPLINGFISLSAMHKNVDKVVIRKFTRFMSEKLGVQEERIIGSLRQYNIANPEHYRCFELKPKLKSRAHLSIFCYAILEYVNQR